MTPKEKAEELIQKTAISTSWGTNYTGGDDIPIYKNQYAKQCALIVVDEIINSREDDGHFDDTLFSTSSEYYTPHPMYLIYWEQVKLEIKNL